MTHETVAQYFRFCDITLTAAVTNLRQLLAANLPYFPQKTVLGVALTPAAEIILPSRYTGFTSNGLKIAANARREFWSCDVFDSLSFPASNGTVVLVEIYFGDI